MSLAAWQKLSINAVGGLLQVGYAESSDLLLVLSNNGRGIFDCLTGVKIARNNQYVFDYFDEATLIAAGFNILEGQAIKTAGLFGGIISPETSDGWKLIERESKDLIKNIYLKYLAEDEVFVANEEPCELRAFGFSPTEKSFIIATSCEVAIFSKLTG